MNDRGLVAALLRMFPAEWRAEYGLELSSLLEQDKLTAAVFWNVLLSGLRQRIRSSSSWINAGTLLALYFLLGLTVNTVCAMTPGSYSAFWNGYLPLELGIGYWLRRGGSRSPGWSTACAVLVGSLPLMALEILRIANVLNPTILDLQGHVLRLGRGFTEFAYRGDPVRHDGYTWCIVVLLSVLFATAIGRLGGQLADAVQAFRIAK